MLLSIVLENIFNIKVKYIILCNICINFGLLPLDKYICNSHAKETLCASDDTMEEVTYDVVEVEIVK